MHNMAGAPFPLKVEDYNRHHLSGVKDLLRGSLVNKTAFFLLVHTGMTCHSIQHRINCKV